MQPTRAESGKFFGKGPDPTFRPGGSDNTAQPWKIASDGSVLNGLA